MTEDKNAKPYVMLSFDIEEFDVPLENGIDISFDRQIAISYEGTRNILRLLKDEGVKATFFCTANFATNAQDLVNEILADGHELASHGYYHSSFENADLKKSKDKLEELFGISIKGYRQARMMPVDEKEIALAGYKYNSSLHPTFIPGRYMNLSDPRNPFYKENVLQFPASVTPIFRLPLFWLSAHNMPMFLYKFLCNRTLKKDNYLNIYFHPWEFVDLNKYKDLKLPFIIRNNSGDNLINRLRLLIKDWKSLGVVFTSIYDFLNDNYLEK